MESAGFALGLCAGCSNRPVRPFMGTRRRRRGVEQQAEVRSAAYVERGWRFFAVLELSFHSDHILYQIDGVGVVVFPRLSSLPTEVPDKSSMYIAQ